MEELAQSEQPDYAEGAARQNFHIVRALADLLRESSDGDVQRVVDAVEDVLEAAEIQKKESEDIEKLKADKDALEAELEALREDTVPARSIFEAIRKAAR